MQKDLVEDIEHGLAEIARSEVLPSVLWQRMQTFMRTRDLLVLPGLPAILVPYGFTRSGLPVGLQSSGAPVRRQPYSGPRRPMRRPPRGPATLPLLVTAVTTGAAAPPSRGPKGTDIRAARLDSETGSGSTAHRPPPGPEEA